MNHIQFILNICLMNSIFVYSLNVDRFQLIDTSSMSETSIDPNSTITSTERPFYPDTFSPGSIAGVAVGSFLLIFIISFGAYQIGRRRFYYLPYHYNYQPV